MNSEIPLTLALSQMEREHEIWLPSPWGEGLGMRANHIGIQQRHFLLCAHRTVLKNSPNNFLEAIASATESHNLKQLPFI